MSRSRPSIFILFLLSFLAGGCLYASDENFAATQRPHSSFDFEKLSHFFPPIDAELSDSDEDKDSLHLAANQVRFPSKVTLSTTLPGLFSITAISFSHGSRHGSQSRSAYLVWAIRSALAAIPPPSLFAGH